jgi:16S rRNA (guanine966-N2)-methyltransferase
MRATLRIVAGSLRGRKLNCIVTPDLRPTPQMVREALFSILGNAIPGRTFVDIFAGTGIVGLEALSRGAERTLFIERDFRLAQELERRLREFEVYDEARLYRTDAYRWCAAWQPPADAVNIFFSPPFDDLQKRPELLMEALTTLQRNVATDSVIIVQGEKNSPLEDLLSGWEARRYSRNILWIWQKADTTGDANVRQ